MNNLKTKKNNKEAVWQENFIKLKDFLIANEDKYPSGLSEDNEEVMLAHWVTIQRRLFKNGQLSEEKINTLNSINFIWDRDNKIWHENFIALKEYVATNYAYPSVSSINKEEQELALWLSTQRSEYKAGTLEQDKIDSLSTIGPIWNPVEAHWQCSVAKLNKFVKENRRYPSIKSLDKNEKSLAMWVNAQRRAIKNQNISAERYQILKDNNFLEVSELNKNTLERSK